MAIGAPLLLRRVKPSLAFAQLATGQQGTRGTGEQGNRLQGKFSFLQNKGTS